MLSLRHSSRILSSIPRASSSSTARFYSSGHGHDEHHGDAHSDAHGEDHGHHEMPLSESESILNKKTAIAAGIVAAVVGYSTFNSSYAESNNGASLLSLVKTPQVLKDLQENYDQYRERVAKQEEIQRMMMFPTGERRTYNNLITSVDAVPGRFHASGTNSQFNTIQDFDSLAPRKTKESPFY